MNMHRSIPRALLLAGVVAVAGIAQAETFDSPLRAGEVSTMTGGSPNALTTNSPYPDGTVVVDTRILGAAPATVTTYGPAPIYYGPTTTQPGMVWDGSRGVWLRDQAAATFDVPARAGEASTMTGGAPNVATNNYLNPPAVVVMPGVTYYQYRY